MFAHDTPASTGSRRSPVAALLGAGLVGWPAALMFLREAGRGDPGDPTNHALGLLSGLAVITALIGTVAGLALLLVRPRRNSAYWAALALGGTYVVTCWGAFLLSRFG